MVERLEPITVLLVDDEQQVRTALIEALHDAGLELIGQADSTTDALKLVVDLRPDVVIMDVNLPGSPSVETIEQLNRQAPASRLLILTRAEEKRVVEAIFAGASGYIPKSASIPAIITALRATAAGESVVSAHMAGTLLECIRERDLPISTTARDAGAAIRAALTERELAIFSQLASGKNNREIAVGFGLSTNTIRNHIASILAKLHLDNRIQAAVQAVRTGIS